MLAGKTSHVRKLVTCSCHRVLLIIGHQRRAIQAITSHGLPRRECTCLEGWSQQTAAAVLLMARCFDLGLQLKLSLAILLKQWPAEGGAFENCLYQMVLLQRLREVLIHLCLDTLLAITHHGVRCEGNDGGSVSTHALLVLANLARGLKATLLYQ